MKTIFSLAAVLMILSGPAMSQDHIDRSSKYSEPGIGGVHVTAQDNMSFAKAVRRKIRHRQPACTVGTCLWFQTCCPRYNVNGDENGHTCTDNGPLPVFCGARP
jgi:hypothetical protein